MIRPTAVESREVCRIWLRYSDSTAGGKSTWLIWQDMAFSRTGMTARASRRCILRRPAGSPREKRASCARTRSTCNSPARP